MRPEASRSCVSRDACYFRCKESSSVRQNDGWVACWTYRWQNTPFQTNKQTIKPNPAAGKRLSDTWEAAWSRNIVLIVQEAARADHTFSEYMYIFCGAVLARALYSVHWWMSSLPASRAPNHRFLSFSSVTRRDRGSWWIFYSFRTSGAHVRISGFVVVPRTVSGPHGIRVSSHQDHSIIYSRNVQPCLTRL